MPATTIATANTILNRVAAEVGITPVVDPYSSQDDSFVQMQHLLNTAGEELLQAYPWELMIREHAIITSALDTGDYELPSDFYYMINQTGWERANRYPIYGPLSAQDWQYLLGRKFVSHTVHVSFRMQEGYFKIYPHPPPDGLEIHYEYVSKNWVSDAVMPTPTYQDKVLTGTDTPLFDRTLISRFLKVKFLEAKGFDTTKAQDDFNQIFSFLTSHDKGARVLDAGGITRGFPYLTHYRNVPDSGYGLS